MYVNFFFRRNAQKTKIHKSAIFVHDMKLAADGYSACKALINTERASNEYWCLY